MRCRNCNSEIQLERVEVGYDYCMDEECIKVCSNNRTLVFVDVNKSNPAVVFYEPPPERVTSISVQGGTFAYRPATKRRVLLNKSTLIEREFIEKVRQLKKSKLDEREFDLELNRLKNDYSAKLRRTDAQIKYVRPSLIQEALND